MSEQENRRRADLLFKIDILKKGGVTLTEITDDMSDDRIEIVYRDGVEALRKKNLRDSNDRMAELMKTFAPMNGNMTMAK